MILDRIFKSERPPRTRGGAEYDKAWRRSRPSFGNAATEQRDSDEDSHWCSKMKLDRGLRPFRISQWESCHQYLACYEQFSECCQQTMISKQLASSSLEYRICNWNCHFMDPMDSISVGMRGYIIYSLAQLWHSTYWGNDTYIKSLDLKD